LAGWLEVCVPIEGNKKRWGTWKEDTWPRSTRAFAAERKNERIRGRGSAPTETEKPKRGKSYSKSWGIDAETKPVNDAGRQKGNEAIVKRENVCKNRNGRDLRGTSHYRRQLKEKLPLERSKAAHCVGLTRGLPRKILKNLL